MKTTEKSISTKGKVQATHPKNADNISKVINNAFWVTTVTFLIFLVMALFIFYNKRQDRLLALQNGKPVLLLNQAVSNTSPEAVTQWASQVITALYNYDMNNMGARTLDAKGYFTETGWTSFLLALDKQGVFDSMNAVRQILTTVPLRPPLIISEKTLGGETYEWTVYVTVRTSVDVGGSSPISNTGNITLTIERMQTKDSPGGYALGIRKITR
jgi:hypothetical protein